MPIALLMSRFLMLKSHESNFRNKNYLRFDEDHEKLLTGLELSDIEGCDKEDDDSENENGNANGIHEENVEQSEINAENFNTLKKILKFSQTAIQI
ncbi:hypothetical protein JTB14_029790 [Gonioctena quinquepunctata]|nr:hypothetical protein JTB14_029790 [Gonioctena quinquepunctata]